ncbi:MAG: carboxypeptidase regulatory-like domain-containing protein [Gemmatimonadales bacterium]
MRKGAGAFCSLLALSGAVSQAQARTPAQQASEAIRYSVYGTVADEDGNVVGPADVELIEGDSVTRRFQTGGGGRFALEYLVSPHVVFRVRRVGFQPATISIDVTAPSHSTKVLVKLQPAVNTLDPVHIAGSPPVALSPWLQAFHEREANNRFGHFVDEEQLDKLRPEHASDALRGIAGVSVTPGPRIGNRVLIRGCAPLIWVNGLRALGAQIDDVVAGSDVAAIEVYNSFAGVPAQFMDRSATCGTILVWLK